MLLPLLLCLTLYQCVYAEINLSEGRKTYTSSKENRLALVEQDKILINNLYEYVDKLQERMDILKRLAAEMSQSLQAAKGRESQYLANPLNSFSLIRHMHEDWKHLLQFLREPLGQEQINFLLKLRLELPMQEDVDQVAKSIHRIQKVYALESTDLVKGIINGVQFNTTLKPLDCYNLALTLFKERHYDMAEEYLWITLEQLRQLKQSELRRYTVLGLQISEVAKLYARTLIGQKREADALIVLNALHEDLQQETPEELLNMYKAQNLTHADADDTDDPDYQRFCRGDFKPKPSRLKCRYNHTTSPFLRLAPFKMEELSLDPYMVVYHDVLSLSEASGFEQMCVGHYKSSYTYNYELEKHVVSDLRTVEGVWLPHDNTTWEDNDLLIRIRQRIRDLTGFELQSMDSIQMLNYGPGGHYVAHHDFFGDEMEISVTLGDRLATLIFYLNDVEMGGDTVFPSLKLSVSPRQGTALFWYNLDGNNLGVNERTLHGACPVIIGHKLAFTRWIHSHEQMFIKPCYG